VRDGRSLGFHIITLLDILFTLLDFASVASLSIVGSDLMAISSQGKPELLLLRFTLAMQWVSL
jgi:hypothetical protein